MSLQMIFFVGERLIIRRIISRQHRIHATHVDTDFAINKSYLLAISKDPSISLFLFTCTYKTQGYSHRYSFGFSEVAKRDDFPQLDIANSSGISNPPHQLHHPCRRTRPSTRKKPKRSTNSASTKERPTASLGFVKDHLTADPERSDVVPRPARLPCGADA